MKYSNQKKLMKQLSSTVWDEEWVMGKTVGVFQRIAGVIFKMENVQNLSLPPKAELLQPAEVNKRKEKLKGLLIFYFKIRKDINNSILLFIKLH